MPSIIHQLKGTAVAPTHTGRTGRDATEITFQRDIGLRLNKIGFFRTGSPANRAHIVLEIANFNKHLRGAGSINEWAGDHRIIPIVIPHHPNSSSTGISGVLHMIQRTGNFAMPAARAFIVIDFYPGHQLFSNPKVLKVSGKGSPVSLHPLSR